MNKFYYIVTALNPVKSGYKTVEHFPHPRHVTRQEARNAKKADFAYRFGQLKIWQIDAVTFKPIKIVR